MDTPREGARAPSYGDITAKFSLNHDPSSGIQINQEQRESGNGEKQKQSGIDDQPVEKGRSPMEEENIVPPNKKTWKPGKCIPQATEIPRYEI